MSEIEKMYLLAGIRKGRMGDEDCAEDCLDYECKNCRYSNFPQFTTEKLINLVMFLINKGDFNIKKGSVDITFESFTNCIAGLVNNLWQDLSEEEKRQIKEVLE